MKTKRWLFNICCSLSLLLCIALIVAWVRSYFVEEVCQRHIGHWEYVKVSGGVIDYYRGPASWGLSKDWQHASWKYRGWRSRQSLWGQFGFGYHEDYVRLGPASVAET